jgi:tripartite ATP-independent transporter DctM subunit
MMEWIPLVMFVVVCLVLMLGYPVAFSLAGTALIFAGVGVATGSIDPYLLQATPNRVFGIINNQTLIAVPLFVFMGVMLERSKIAENLLTQMAQLFSGLPGGLGICVAFVGMLLAASTGIVGATVVTMGLLSLPAMMKNNYDPKLATGVICASGTLGQIIPPSIVLVLLGDVISSANQQAQMKLGNYAPETVSVGDLFIGALIPGLLLVTMYIIYIGFYAFKNPQKAPAIEREGAIDWKEVCISLLMPLTLILAVLGSILKGIATPTEAASVGAIGAMFLAIVRREFNLERLRSVMDSTLKTTSMVFMILIGASIFSLVFRTFEGDELIHQAFQAMPGGVWTALLISMVVMFLLGFILDFIEITFVVVPIVAPVLLFMGLDPVWLGIMIALNLQTSFLTPPFGFALFYLRGVAPPSIKTSDIYRGVMPFIVIQLILLGLLAVFPELATELPKAVYS